MNPISGQINRNPDIPSKHWEIQLKAAEELGLGLRSYNLIEVEIEKKEQ